MSSANTELRDLDANKDRDEHTMTGAENEAEGDERMEPQKRSEEPEREGKCTGKDRGTPRNGRTRRELKESKAPRTRCSAWMRSCAFTMSPCQGEER